MADIRSWSMETVVVLLVMYKSFTCLWKIKSDEYKNKNLREDAYTKLVDFCKEKGFTEANRDFVVKKIQSLRGSFRKELEKVNDSLRSGTGVDDVYTSSLWYFNHLMFTKDQEAPTHSFSNDVDEPQDEIVHETAESSNNNADEAEEGGTGETEQIQQVVNSVPSATPPAPRKKKKSTPHYQEDFFRICSETLKSSNRELTEFDAVGMNVGKKLAKMDAVQAIYAESLINEVLRKGLWQQFSPQTNLLDGVSGIETPTSAYSVQSNRSLHTLNYPQDNITERPPSHLASENIEIFTKTPVPLFTSRSDNNN